MELQRRGLVRESDPGVSDMAVSRKHAGALIVSALVLGAFFGLLIGYNSVGVSVGTQTLDQLTREADLDVREKLLGEINAENIRGNLR